MHRRSGVGNRAAVTHADVPLCAGGEATRLLELSWASVALVHLGDRQSSRTSKSVTAMTCSSWMAAWTGSASMMIG